MVVSREKFTFLFWSDCRSWNSLCQTNVIHSTGSHKYKHSNFVPDEATKRRNLLTLMLAKVAPQRTRSEHQLIELLRQQEAKAVLSLNIMQYKWDIRGCVINNDSALQAGFIKQLLVGYCGDSFIIPDLNTALTSFTLMWGMARLINIAHYVCKKREESNLFPNTPAHFFRFIKSSSLRCNLSFVSLTTWSFFRCSRTVPYHDSWIEYEFFSCLSSQRRAQSLFFQKKAHCCILPHWVPQKLMRKIQLANVHVCVLCCWLSLQLKHLVWTTVETLIYQESFRSTWHLIQYSGPQLLQSPL